MTRHPPTEPHPTELLHWEDFPVGQVRVFGAMPVTREAVLAFASQFDPQPFHLDDEAANASLFGGLSASGWHTCAMAMRMMCDAYLLQSASLGSPGIRQPQMAQARVPRRHAGRALHPCSSRAPWPAEPGVGLIRSQWDVSNQHGDVVLSMQGWGMFRRRVSQPG